MICDGHVTTQGGHEMPKAEKKLSAHSTVLVSASELAEIVGIDLETVNFWVRRGIITRTPIGGRHLRNRL
jgi:hypothetical protein